MELGIVGYRGKMGEAILQEAQKAELKVVSLHSRSSKHNQLSTDSLAELVDKSEVIIDFSRPETSRSVVELALKAKKAYLCGTTGFTQDHMDYLREAGKEIKVFYSANMSVGIAILTRIAQEAIQAFQKYNLDPEINIIERHHKEKVDKPSGTAMTLANKIKNTTDLAPQDIVSLRYGTVIGEHELIISSELEVLSLKHQVMDRKVFAQGAIKAAKFLYKEDLPGFYTMEDLLKI